MREVERTCQHDNNTYLPDLGQFPHDLCGCQITVSLYLEWLSFTNGQATGSGLTLHHLAQIISVVHEILSTLQYTLDRLYQVGYWIARCNNTFDLALGMIKRHKQRELNMARGRQVQGWLPHHTNKRISLFNQSILSELRELDCHSSLSV